MGQGYQHFLKYWSNKYLIPKKLKTLLRNYDYNYIKTNYYISIYWKLKSYLEKNLLALRVW